VFYEPILSVLIFNVTDEQAADSLPYKLSIIARCTKFNFKRQWC